MADTLDTATDPQEPTQPKSPMDYLKFFPGAPTEADINSFRVQVPGARLRLLPLRDGKRLFLLRGFTASELLQVQLEVAKVPPEKQLVALQSEIAVRCTLWTSIVTSGKLQRSDLDNSGAGLASTLYQSIMDLSDYNDPEYLDQLYVDL